MAEREGFEPSVAFRLHVISNHAHSTTLPPLRVTPATPESGGTNWRRVEEMAGAAAGQLGIWAAKGQAVFTRGILPRKNRRGKSAAACRANDLNR
jgi:hypothetical protein